MSVREFPEVASIRIPPPPRNKRMLAVAALLLLVAYLMLLGWRSSAPVPPVPSFGSLPPVTVVSYDFGVLGTFAALALFTPVPTVTRTPTITPTAMRSFVDQYGYCAFDSPPGTVCVPHKPAALTPTPVPTCYPDTPALLCRVPGETEDTKAREETQ